jgi:exonuclease SbcC
MIPLRIRLKGFMSYRDEQELSFEGATLWMLAGQNGAGKSAIFDAMTYALYDQHRLGAQHADELINKERDELLVDFEFRSGDDTFRILRTLSRKNNRVTRQVFHVAGPHAPNPSLSGEQPVLGTDSSQGFKEWVQQQIGLDYDTFTASVLLCQGKADALLEADPKERHDILSQIVDLAAYERLQRSADERRKKSEGRADLLHEQLSAIESVSDADVSAGERRAAELDALQKASHAALLHLAQLKGEAKRWEQLSAEQTDLRRALDVTRHLLAQADTIEREAARLDELRQVVPLLQAVFDTRKRFNENAAALQTCSDQVAAAKLRTNGAERALDELVATADALKEEHAKTVQARDEAQKELLDLHPQLMLIAAMKELRTQLVDADRRLLTFLADLDQRCGDLLTEVERLEEASRALPWLEELATQRSKRLRSDAAIRAMRESIAAIVQQIPEDIAAQGIGTAQLYAEHEQQAVTLAQANLKQVEERQRRLQAIEGKPLCSYCGQPLTAEHIAAERERIAEELAQAHTATDSAKASHAAALRLKQQEEEAQRELDTAMTEAQMAQNGSESALKALPAVYRQRAAVASHEVYPSVDDLASLRGEISHLVTTQNELATAQESLNQRDQQRAIRDQLALRLAEKEQTCPPEVAAQIEAREQEVNNRLTVAERDISRLTEPLAQADMAVASARTQLDDLRRQAQESESERASLERLRAELERNAAERVETVPEGWRAVCEGLTREQVSAWEAEQRVLAGADTRAGELADARSERTIREERLGQVVAQLEEIPIAARCEVSVLEAHEREAQDRYEEESHAHQAAVSEFQALSLRRERRSELEQQRRDAARQAHVYRVLTRLLGRDYLQRHLLLQAEASIIEHANLVLERISGGSLRLELRAVDENARTGQKALDLVAYNELTADKPLLVGALSGSQRFRVAVSLALGIGEFASEGNRPIETVIIDEGFGSLDQQGRQEMIHELQNLKTELKRIILVSHQEEFTDKFTRGYYVELVQNATRVRDLEHHSLGADLPDTIEMSEGDAMQPLVSADISS